jgi:predicted membrane channel-forming protein YqfA (hemolysin III family)
MQANPLPPAVEVPSNLKKPAVKTGLKILFWILLGCLSVIFAEVSCYSSPFPFTTGWGLGVVLPLYGLHTLVLGAIVLKAKKVTLQALFTAGMLFGLYEAIITKVLWNPTWGPSEPMIAGVAGLQTAVLVLFWHPWFAFILPLMAGERLTSASTIIQQAFPTWMRRLFNGKNSSYVLLCLLAFYFGMSEGINTLSMESTLLSVLESLVVFTLLVILWKKVTRGQPFNLRMLMPNRKEFTILSVLLGTLYLLAFFFIRFDALPKTLMPYLSIGLLYLVSIILLVRNIKNSPHPPIEFPRQPERWWLLKGLGFAAIFTLSSLLWMNAKPIAQQIVLITWIAGVLAGMEILVSAIVKAVKKAKQKEISGNLINGNHS